MAGPSPAMTTGAKPRFLVSSLPAFGRPALHETCGRPTGVRPPTSVLFLSRSEATPEPSPGACLAIFIAVNNAMGIASLRQQETRVAYRVAFTVMAGLVPAIGRGTLPLRMAGTKPGHDGKGWFHPGRSLTAGRCGLAMTGTLGYRMARVPPGETGM